MPDVNLENVRKTFGEVVAVDGIALNVADGEMVTLLGPSGCGKTTTLRMIAGLEVPDAGCIGIGEMTAFDGETSVNVAPELRNLGMVFQSYAIWPHMTVYENVALAPRLREQIDAWVRQQPASNRAYWQTRLAQLDADRSSTR